MLDFVYGSVRASRCSLMNIQPGSDHDITSRSGWALLLTPVHLHTPDSLLIADTAAKSKLKAVATQMFKFVQSLQPAVARQDKHVALFQPAWLITSSAQQCFCNPASCLHLVDLLCTSE